jgi:hypothetical protein
MFFCQNYKRSTTKKQSSRFETTSKLKEIFTLIMGLSVKIQPKPFKCVIFLQNKISSSYFTKKCSKKEIFYRRQGSESVKQY